ncbi:MAG: sulfonate ABC transporter [Syntrophothermus sp.]
MRQIKDECPSCGAELSASLDAPEGQIIECAYCGAELELYETEDGMTLRLASEV